MANVSEEKRVEQVKERFSDHLLAQPGVWGVGVEQTEDGTLCLAVHVEGPTQNYRRLPHTIEGVPVVIVPSGPFVAYGNGRRG
jgi:hypothetical protein